MRIIKLTSLVFLLVALSLPARAQFTFTTNNGAIIITRYLGNDNVVAIPSATNGWTVKTIGDFAFGDCSNLTEVSIPDTVTFIDNSAFIGCANLASVTVPLSVTNLGFQAFTDCGLTNVTILSSVASVGTSAFLDCFHLAKVTLSDGITLLGYDSFYGCSNLTYVSIPKNCTNIQDEAFAQCYGLTNIAADAQNQVYSSRDGVLFNKTQTELAIYPPGLVGSYGISNGVTSIGNGAFNLCFNLSGVSIPNSVTNIGSTAFNGCTGLTNLVFPTNVTVIGDDAFSGCGGLVTLTIPNSVATIGSGAFSGTSITNVLIPASVTNIGSASFANCSRLSAIKVDTNNPAYSSAGGVLYDLNQSTLVEFPMGLGGTFSKPGNYVIPNGVTRIGDQAFEGCYFMSSVTIPSGLTSIGNFAFSECARLFSINVPAGVTNIGDFAFSGTSVTNLTLPSSLTTLGALGYWTSLRSLYFEGNAPARGPVHYVTLILNNATAYFLPGTSGWEMFGQTAELSTALWLPALTSGDGHFGLQTNQFGFKMKWASGRTVVVETCTNLSLPNWQPVQTNTLISDSTDFNDPQWTNYSTRFYRLRAP